MIPTESRQRRVVRASFVRAVQLLALAGCGGETPIMVDFGLVPIAVERGWAALAVLESDCPTTLDPKEVSATWRLASDRTFFLELEGFPSLRGALESGRGRISGEVSWMGARELIRCAVEGDADATGSAIHGEVAEAMTSEHELNCSSRYGFTLRR